MIKNDLFKSVLNKINSFDIDEECWNIALSVSIIFPSQNVYLKSFMIWKCWIFFIQKIPFNGNENGRHLHSYIIYNDFQPRHRMRIKEHACYTNLSPVCGFVLWSLN